MKVSNSIGAETRYKLLLIGICLVSTAEAKKIAKELKGDHALAVLSPSNITGVGEEVHVLVEDPSGRWQTRRRFMLQLGTNPLYTWRGSRGNL